MNVACKALHADTPLAASSHAQLCALIGAVAPAEPPWVIDLTLGAWRPREAARQLAAQAGIDLPATGSADAAPPSWTALVGTNIDAEARGPADIQIADRDARLLCPLIGGASLLIVWLPQHPDLPDDNAWFVRLASARLKQAGTRVVLARRRDDVAPASPCLIPHLATDGDAPYLHALRGGQTLCCPSQRPRLPGAPRGRFDQLAARHDTPPWLRAYAWCYGNNYFVDSASLSETAWEYYAQGANSLAMLLLQRAFDCARDPIQRASILARMQGIRIATQSFAQAAMESPPASNLPPALGDFLRQSIGWARIMLGDTNELASYFGDQNAAATSSGEDLYAMNIHALGLARAGRKDQALALELRIEAARRQHGSTDARIAYINNLNIARLYKQRADLAAASAYYERAFATNHCTRSHAESMHAAWIRASMARANGQAPEAGAWLMQAALHWLADPLPEAVPVRLAQAVLGATLPAPEARCEAMSAALLTAFSSAMASDEFGCGVVAPLLSAPAFAGVDAAVPQAYVGRPGWGLGWSDTAGANDLARSAVATQVGAVLHALGLPSHGTFVVDDQCQRELPRTRAELVTLAVLRCAHSCSWQGEQAILGEHLVASLLLSPGKAPAHFDLGEPAMPRLRHGRHGRVHSITPAVVALAETLAREGPLTVAALNGTPLSEAWRLAWTTGAIEIALSETACTQAGINWRTNAT